MAFRTRSNPGATRQRHLRSFPRRAEEGALDAGSLEEALDCLEDDHGFLLKGDVFTEELIETFINYKRQE